MASMAELPTTPFWTRIPDRPLHYDRQGQPISFRRYIELNEGWTGPYRRIGYHEIVGIGAGRYGYAVSTIWLGIDHAFGYGPPLIFETMAWDGPDSLTGGDDMGYPRPDTMNRYHTEAEAYRGHMATVEALAASVWGAIVVDTLPALIRAEAELALNSNTGISDTAGL